MANHFVTVKEFARTALPRLMEHLVFPNLIYKDFSDKSSFLSTLHMQEARDYIKSGVIQGGMIPKVEACLTSLEKGTGKTHIIDGRLDHSIILEIFTSQGIGTQVVR